VLLLSLGLGACSPDLEMLQTEVNASAEEEVSAENTASAEEEVSAEEDAGFWDNIIRRRRRRRSTENRRAALNRGTYYLKQEHHAAWLGVCGWKTGCDGSWYGFYGYRAKHTRTEWTLYIYGTVVYFWHAQYNTYLGICAHNRRWCGDSYYGVYSYRTAKTRTRFYLEFNHDKSRWYIKWPWGTYLGMCGWKTNHCGPSSFGVYTYPSKEGRTEWIFEQKPIIDQVVYRGCKTGGTWFRQADVRLNQRGAEICIKACERGGYRYAGFECPMAHGDKVHCQCAREANPNIGVAVVCQKNLGHCNGRNMIGHYSTGGHGRGSIYEIPMTMTASGPAASTNVGRRRTPMPTTPAPAPAPEPDGSRFVFSACRHFLPPAVETASGASVAFCPVISHNVCDLTASASNTISEDAKAGISQTITITGSIRFNCLDCTCWGDIIGASIGIARGISMGGECCGGIGLSISGSIGFSFGIYFDAPNVNGVCAFNIDVTGSLSVQAGIVTLTISVTGRITLGNVVLGEDDEGTSPTLRIQAFFTISLKVGLVSFSVRIELGDTGEWDIPPGPRRRRRAPLCPGESAMRRHRRGYKPCPTGGGGPPSRRRCPGRHQSAGLCTPTGGYIPRRRSTPYVRPAPTRRRNNPRLPRRRAVPNPRRRRGRRRAHLARRRAGPVCHPRARRRRC